MPRSRIVIIPYILKSSGDSVPQQVRLTVLLQPGDDARGQFGKVVHGQGLEGEEHLLHDRLKHLELDVVWHAGLRLSGAALLVLQHLLVAGLDHGEPGDFLLQRDAFVVLLLLVLVQVQDILDGLLQDGGLAQLVARRLVLLTRGHEVLQGVVPLLDGIASLLLGLRVRFAATLLVAGHRGTGPVVAVVLVVRVVGRGVGRVQTARAGAPGVVVQDARIFRAVWVGGEGGTVSGTWEVEYRGFS